MRPTHSPLGRARERPSKALKAPYGHREALGEETDAEARERLRRLQMRVQTRLHELGRLEMGT
jgi:hypothetical protein